MSIFRAKYCRSDIILLRAYHEHRTVVSLSVVVGSEGQLARQQLQFLVIKMPLQFHFYAQPDGIVVEIPDTVTETGIYHRPHLVLQPPDSVKVIHGHHL